MSRKSTIAAAILLGVLASCAPSNSDYGAQPTEVNVTNDSQHRFGELQIAVNPTNPDNIAMAVVALGTSTACITNHDPMCDLVTAHLAYFDQLGVNLEIPNPRGFYERDDFNLVFVYVSNDRGRTWEKHVMPAYPEGMERLTGQGDPSIVATRDGAFFVSWNAADWGTPDHALPACGIAITVSHDSGQTWSAPHLTGTPCDGQKLVADPVTGTVYGTSSTFRGPRSTGNPETPFNPTNTRWVVSSTDGVTWTEPQQMGGAGGASAAHGVFATAFRAANASAGGGLGSMFAAPNGQLCGDAPAPCTIFQTSTDSGASWTRHVVSVPSDYTGSPMVAADPSREGHFALALLRNNGGEFHVYETNDSGASWTGAAIVTEDASKVHILPWMTYSRDGVLGVMWRTRQPIEGQAAPAGPAQGGGGFEQPSNPYNVWAAISRDGGATFSAPLRITREDSPPSPTPGPFSGAGDDYSALALDGDYVYVGWADWRPGDRQNYFSAVRLDAFQANAN